MRADAPFEAAQLHRPDQAKRRRIVLMMLYRCRYQDIRIDIDFHSPANLRIRSSRCSRTACTTSKPDGTLPV